MTTKKFIFMTSIAIALSACASTGQPTQTNVKAGMQTTQDNIRTAQEGVNTVRQGMNVVRDVMSIFGR